ncbi:hypothetical protein HNQ77_000780 [Silvibacterium bohemicum]|uniref:Uncharacterized protein n=1 Tax=Silvibacterium bohemicum TaxID=1577686 RepID=A0A841JN88_9BACT|nr:hypothetical protein [Silvibacterium bohemicum]MBB6142842.1 hypothetical protein [Silvibacterium bohemicum]
MAGAIAAALLIMIFAWPKHIQTVSAAELLSRAEAAQEDTRAGQHSYRLNVGASTCSTTDASWSQPTDSDSDLCGRVRVQLLKAHWDDRRMLSARSYRQWHDSLSRRRDSVLHQEPYWTIKTDTDQGLLRSASLSVRSSDYRPVGLTLEFAGLERVSVIESEPAAERRVYVPSREPETTVKGESVQDVDPAEDAIEAQAWKLLRSVGGDSGWEATITRKGSEVRVVGFIDDASRKEKFEEAFAQLQGVSTDLERPEALPKRGHSGEGQPLAEMTLERLIPDSHQRGERVTEIADASRAVVGKAFFCDQLIARRNAFQDSPAAHTLTPLIAEERADLFAATARLSGLLEPLLEPVQNNISHVPLSYSQARQLDTAILSLVNAAPQQTASLEETQEHIRSLLSKK